MKSWTVDKGLMLAILFFMGLGLVQVYSSSYIFATESYGDGLLFFRRQLVFVALGLVLLVGVSMIPWKYIERYGVLIWVAAVCLLILTFVPGLSIKGGGAIRWLRFPMGLRFEPAELLKVTFPLLIASFLVRRQKENGQTWKLLFFQAGLIIMPLVLLLRQPDFGSFVICSGLVFALMFAFGLKWRYIFAGILTAVPVLTYLIVQTPYRYARVLTFLDPWADPSAKGFQAIQSLLSFYSGGLWGAGLGQGQGKLFFLPEAHTDFTLAVLGEELGFIGVAIVLTLYGFIVFRGLQVALRADSEFKKAVALGVTLCFAAGVVINSGVVLGLLPTKGLTLPFLSYGGSSLVSTCFGLGILLNIDRQWRLKRLHAFSGYRI